MPSLKSAALSNGGHQCASKCQIQIRVPMRNEEPERDLGPFGWRGYAHSGLDAEYRAIRR